MALGREHTHAHGVHAARHRATNVGIAENPDRLPADLFHVERFPDRCHLVASHPP